MNLQTLLDRSWQQVLQQEIDKPYFKNLLNFLEAEYEKSSVFPPQELIFNALKITPFDQVKVVLLGQDPYHGKGQAHGLCFSVPEGEKMPPSLKNIFKELKNDVGLELPPHGCLLSWAKQGVLLLNTTLTVREKSPLSHQNKGWEKFTDAIIAALTANKEKPIVFVLWGKSAQEKCRFLLEEPPLGANEFFQKNRLILLAPHPSPLSCHQGFFGCKHFSKINTFLTSHRCTPIDWDLYNNLFKKEV